MCFITLFNINNIIFQIVNENILNQTTSIFYLKINNPIFYVRKKKKKNYK